MFLAQPGEHFVCWPSFASVGLTECFVYRGSDVRQLRVIFLKRRFGTAVRIFVFPDQFFDMSIDRQPSNAGVLLQPGFQLGGIVIVI